MKRLVRRESLVALALATVSCARAPEAAEAATRRAASSARPPTPVPELAPGRPAAPAAKGPSRPADSGRFVAVIAARHTASVTSQVEGTLLSLDVRLGDFVAAGDKLATIDDRPMREAAAAARANAAVRGAEARVAAVRARHAAAEFQRQQRLQREGLVSEQAREAAESVRAETKAEFERAQAAAREAAAALTSALRSLEQAVVRAPVAGLVATRFVDPGNEVRRGDALVRIVARETPWIRFGMPAERRDSVKVGDAVEFTSMDGMLVVPGRISHVAPDVDPLSELVIAEATLEAAEAGLYPGLGGYVSPLGAAALGRTARAKTP